MRLKFMGVADVKQVLAGDNIGGTLNEPLAVDLVWDRSNGWVIDTDEEKYANVPDEVWEYLVLNDNFMDVTDFVRTPLNQNQKTFLGMREGEQKTEAEEEEQRQAALDEAFAAARELAAAANNREAVLAKLQSGGATREELMELAKQHNIKGRTSMKVDELQNALVDLIQKDNPLESGSTGGAHTGSTISGAAPATGSSTTGGRGTGGTTTVGGSTAGA